MHSMPCIRLSRPCKHVARQLCRPAIPTRLERPLIANVSLAYSPTIHRFLPSVQNAGIENLTISFPLTKYPGHLQVCDGCWYAAHMMRPACMRACLRASCRQHHQAARAPLLLSCSPLSRAPRCLCQERGYNGIHFNQLAHSWVRDVRIHNADSGFYSWGMVASTVSGLTISSGARGYDNGHRGIWLERGQDNLITNFRCGRCWRWCCSQHCTVHSHTEPHDDARPSSLVMCRPGRLLSVLHRLRCRMALR